jgi:arylsulfatase A-like enzyme
MRLGWLERGRYLAWLAMLCAGPLAGAAERPNIILLLADDQSYETIGALGHSQVQTPNLDALVRSGLSFTQAYNMGSWSGAVCVASRTMLNTGRFLWRAHEVAGSLEAEREAGRLWSEQLRRAGYRTYLSGKWHVDCRVAAAFDVVQHLRPGMPNQTPEGYNRPLSGQPDPWSPSDPRFGGYWKGGRHWSEVLADDALGFLQEATDREEPFFMYLAFNAPHDPRQAPQAFVDRYPAAQVAIPTNFLAEYPFKDSIGCGPALRDEALGPFPRTEHAVQVHRQEYYALITHLDQQIGRILQALRKSPRARNTYVFFTADHGLAVGHHGLFGKQNMYDHSVRVPLIVVGPRIPAGKRCDAPVYLQDVMPTSLELAGVAPAAHVEFKSLGPLIRGEATESYDAIYGAYLDLQRMVTLDGYKLIVYPVARRVRLYHLAGDPDELIDLASEPQYRPIARNLFQKLLELQSETGDGLELETTFAAWF